MRESVEPRPESPKGDRRERYVGRLGDWSLALGLSNLPFSACDYVLFYVRREYPITYYSESLSFIVTSLGLMCFLGGFVTVVCSLAHRGWWRSLWIGVLAMGVCAPQIFWFLKIAALPSV